MELQYYGANCVRITTKKATIVIDDNLSALGLKSTTKPNDISLKTSFLAKSDNSNARFTADTPGEYEISGVIIKGIAARAHMDEEGKQSAVMYTVEADDSKIGVIGHIFPELSEEQLEEIGTLDVAIIPIGNSGYTLDGVGALSLIKKIEPKVVIPTHYSDKAIKYPVPQLDLSDAIKNLGMEPAETVDKFKIKPGEITDTIKLVILNRQGN